MKVPCVVRRRGLYDWLCDVGFTKQDVDALIDAGTIPRKFYPRKPRRKPPISKASKQRPKPGETPVLVNGRAWYQTRVIAKLLDIPLE